MGEIIHCDACGTELEVAPHKLEKNDHHFCDRDCYHNWKSDDWEPPWQVDEKPTIKCEMCGDVVEVYPYEKDSRKFCGRECADEYKTTLREDETGNYQGGKTSYTCSECGDEFKEYPAEGKNVFCSIECYNSAKSRRFQGEDNPAWAGGWDWWYGANWEEQRKKAIERDNHTCQRCGMHADEMERSPDVHHKKRIGWFKEEYDEPEWWEKGNSLDNLVTYCRNCHQKVESPNYD